jgi:hypothetical protein
MLAAAWALGAAGCLERTPPPVSGLAGADAGPPVSSDAGVGVPADAGPLGDAASAWVGTWAFTSGSEGLLCGGDLSVVSPEGVLAISLAPSGRSLLVLEDGCPFAFTLVGDTATSEPNQACAAWSVPTIPDWTLTLRPDGTLAEKLGGQVWLDGQECEISGGSTLSRR